eukprot:TRINITY_DN47299_c0_g1_i1.p1 TRINITY_DN47299_c0_g1~~TRINITY_DN47299_c0_g1_i1.p1  ORF type:complete len:351 (+),score=105.91 TRINITY_DN47299_c0_g1_i1:59-1054(+)
MDGDGGEDADAASTARQQELSTVIKEHHRRMRERVRSGDSIGDVWDRNRKDEGSLKEYASAMKELGETWEMRQGSNRLDWIVTTIAKYFWGDAAEPAPPAKRQRVSHDQDRCGLVTALLKPLKREHFEQKGERLPAAEVEKHTAAILSEHGVPAGSRARVLDVGSCYNPLMKHERAKELLDVTAVDLCPAPDTSVLQCDFVRVSVSAEPMRVADGRVENLSYGSFDAVCFCLVLSYMPCPKLRLVCVQNACRVLRHQGLLLIEEPRTAGRRDGKWLDGWRETIESLGMRRTGSAVMAKIVCVCFRKASAEKEPETLSAAKQELGLPLLADS